MYSRWPLQILIRTFFQVWSIIYLKLFGQEHVIGKSRGRVSEPCRNDFTIFDQISTFWSNLATTSKTFPPSCSAIHLFFRTANFKESMRDSKFSLSVFQLCLKFFTLFHFLTSFSQRNQDDLVISCYLTHSVVKLWNIIHFMCNNCVIF